MSNKHARFGSLIRGYRPQSQGDRPCRAFGRRSDVLWLCRRPVPIERRRHGQKHSHGNLRVILPCSQLTYFEAVWPLKKEDYRSAVAIELLIRLAAFRYKAYPEKAWHDKPWPRTQPDRTFGFFGLCPLGQESCSSPVPLIFRQVTSSLIADPEYIIMKCFIIDNTFVSLFEKSELGKAQTGD